MSLGAPAGCLPLKKSSLGFQNQEEISRAYFFHLQKACTTSGAAFEPNISGVLEALVSEEVSFYSFRWSLGEGRPTKTAQILILLCFCGSFFH